MSGEKFDQSSDPEFKNDGRRGKSGRKFLGVHFTCCNTYARVYINHNGTGYVGHCPKCARAVRFKVGKDGTGQRFFRAQ